MDIFTYPPVFGLLILALMFFTFTLWGLFGSIRIHLPNLYIALIAPSLFTALAIRYLDARYALPDPRDVQAVRILAAAYLYLLFFLGSSSALHLINQYQERRVFPCFGLFAIGWLWVSAVVAISLGLLGFGGFLAASSNRLLTPSEIEWEELFGLTFLFGLLTYNLCLYGKNKYAVSRGFEP